MSSDRICLLTDDGSLITVKLADALTKQGWKVVVLSFPESTMTEKLPLPERINHVILSEMTEEHLKQKLETVVNNYGEVGAFIHLNPVNVTKSQAKALVKQVFLIAKHLKKSLDEAVKQGRSWFVTVTHLDGELGLGENSKFESIIGGFFGLTKTLGLEWQNVFCRTIDLSPDLDIEIAVNSIIAELYDPNLLISEVGYSLHKRTTITAEN